MFGLLAPGCAYFRPDAATTGSPAPVTAPPPPLPREWRAGRVGNERDLPAVQREFRGAWVATVGNIDWPSRPGLSTREQQAELGAIVERAADLRLNALVFQVRTSCDALYESSLEPWSEYLTGVQGRAPSPAYDPLALAIDLCHARGIELHAWINPFRARAKDSVSQPAAKHISREKPALVRAYGEQLWLDPGEPAAREHSLHVLADIVRRYDIDGVHIDDYFYPYPVKDERGRSLAFPDDASFKRFARDDGGMKRDDWRRANINGFVRQMYETTRRIKPHVKVGISPFGIWRSGQPTGVRGLDAYTAIYADSRLWLREGWCDYFAPQLYWRIDAPEQSYTALLEWWLGQNSQGRHLWPGSHASKWPAAEIGSQIAAARQRRAGGTLLFSMRSIMENRGGLATTLVSDAFATPALAPPSPWLDNQAPLPPDARADDDANGLRQLAWRPGDERERAFRWIVHLRYGREWRVSVLPGSVYRFAIAAGADGRGADFAAVSAVDRTGNVGRPMVFP